MTIEMSAMQVLAPAKINLSLMILGRRSDGFHEIETLIAPISLYDKIDIDRQSRWIDFSCVSPTKLKKKLSILLCKPAFLVSSAWAYSRWQGSKEIPGISYQSQNFDGQTLLNDLERPVFEKFVFLAQLKAWLLKQVEVRAAL